jgi:hypothetical protein
MSSRMLHRDHWLPGAVAFDQEKARTADEVVSTEISYINPLFDLLHLLFLESFKQDVVQEFGMLLPKHGERPNSASSSGFPQLYLGQKRGLFARCVSASALFPGPSSLSVVIFEPRRAKAVGPCIASCSFRIQLATATAPAGTTSFLGYPKKAWTLSNELMQANTCPLLTTCCFPRL